MKGVNNFVFARPDDKLLNTMRIMYLICSPISRKKARCVVVDEKSGVVTELLGYDPLSYKKVIRTWPIISAPTPVQSSDIAPPTIVLKEPDMDAANVDITAAPIKIVFSKSMNDSTINSNTIRLKNASGEQIEVGISLDSSDQKTVTITPKSPLLEGGSYIISVAKGIKDSAGNTILSEKTFSFKT
jgi:hypothetical protein